MPGSSRATRRSHQGVRQRPIVAIWLAGLAGVAFARFSAGLEVPSTSDQVAIELALLALMITAAWWAANVIVLTVALRRHRPLPSLQLPGARRAAQGLLILTMSTSCVVNDDAPRMVYVGAAESSASTSSLDVSTSTVSTDAPTTDAPTTSTVPTTAVSTTAPAPPHAPVPSLDADPSPTEPAPGLDGPSTTGVTIDEHQVVVRPGDNLWAMTEATLIAHGNDDPSCAEITDYWRKVLAANRVRSGDPNVIVPGEAITMPAHDLVEPTPDEITLDEAESPMPADGSVRYGFHHR